MKAIAFIIQLASAAYQMRGDVSEMPRIAKFDDLAAVERVATMFSANVTAPVAPLSNNTTNTNSTNSTSDSSIYS